MKAISILIIFSFLASLASAEWYNAEENIMGTRISVELWHADEQVARESMAQVMGEMRRIDALMSPYIETSELYILNAQAGIRSVKVSEEIYSLIEKSLFYSKISDGSFDISFASVGRHYDYREQQAPTAEEFSATFPAVDYRLIMLDKKERRIAFNHPQLRIDLGGIAKGHAVDQSIRLLERAGITSAIVSAGGDSRILGDRKGTPWMIGIRHPRDDKAHVVRMPLANIAISTSGDYERYFIRGEERVHHIINPSTGKSVDSVQSASILAPLAVDSDALSTTVFVLGVKKGLALVNRLPGIDAVIIDANGQLHYSEDLLRAIK